MNLSIGSSAFNGCTKAISITIPNSIKVLEVNVFAQCYQLPSISIPSSVIEIRASAFASNGNLKSIVIPTSVTLIGIYILLLSSLYLILL